MGDAVDVVDGDKNSTINDSGAVSNNGSAGGTGATDGPDDR